MHSSVLAVQQCSLCPEGEQNPPLGLFKLCKTHLFQMTTQSNHLHATKYCLRSNLVLITPIMCMLLIAAAQHYMIISPVLWRGKQSGSTQSSLSRQWEIIWLFPKIIVFPLQIVLITCYSQGHASSQHAWSRPLDGSVCSVSWDDKLNKRGESPGYPGLLSL